MFAFGATPLYGAVWAPVVPWAWVVLWVAVALRVAVALCVTVAVCVTVVELPHPVRTTTTTADTHRPALPKSLRRT
jgi:hypothetical protein